MKILLLVLFVLITISTVNCEILIESDVDPDAVVDDDEHHPDELVPFQHEDKVFYFKMKSFRDCRGKEDKISFKRLFYNRTISVPGVIDFNGTVIIKSKLPSNWSVKTEVNVKSWLGWIRIPHSYDSKFQNICTDKNIDRCINATRKYNFQKVCRCDMDEGSYDIPNMEMPLRIKESKNGRVSIRKSLLKKYLHQKGSEFKIETVLVSGIDGKRFGCFRAQFLSI